MEWICMRALFSDKAAMLRVSYALHQCVFIACTEYDHLLFTACSLSADIVAGNPSSRAVQVDPHEDHRSPPFTPYQSLVKRFVWPGNSFWQEQWRALEHHS